MRLMYFVLCCLMLLDNKSSEKSLLVYSLSNLHIFWPLALKKLIIISKEEYLF